MPRSVRCFLLLAAATLALGGSARSTLASSPPSDPFPAFKDEMIRLFHECTYINLSVPGHQLVGVNPREEARQQWDVMTKEVEHASKGWAMVLAPEAILIACETPEHLHCMLEVYYVGGVLGLDNSPVSLKVGPKFKQAIDEMLAIAEQMERERRREPSDPESWPVNDDQAREIAASLVRAAGLDPGGGANLLSNPPKGTPGGVYTVLFPSIARVTVDGSDGSILAATLSPDTGPPAREVSRDQAVSIASKVVAALGLTAKSSSFSSADLVTRNGTRAWQLTWQPAGSGARGSAKIEVAADTGRLLSAGESMPDVHPPIPPRPEPPSQPPPVLPQVPKPSVPVKVSADRAVEIAGAFAKAMDLPFGDGATATFLDPEKEYLTPPAWKVEFYSFSTFNVDANTGKVIHFGDLAAAMAQLESTGSLTAEEALQIAQPVAAALGLPQDAQRQEPRPGTDGRWSVRWARVGPHGAVYHDDSLTVSIGRESRVTGARLRWWSPPPDNTQLTVTRERAEKVALDFARSRGRIKEEPTITAELQVVHPNDYWTDHPLTHIRYDSPTRLAWVVTLGQGRVPLPEHEGAPAYQMIMWVDAANEAILGGTQSSGRLRDPAPNQATSTNHQPPSQTPSSSPEAEPTGASPRPSPSRTSASIPLLAGLAVALTLTALLGIVLRTRRR